MGLRQKRARRAKPSNKFLLFSLRRNLSQTLERLSLTVNLQPIMRLFTAARADSLG
jgi:hypothetical protein